MANKSQKQMLFDSIVNSQIDDAYKAKVEANYNAWAQQQSSMPQIDNDYQAKVDADYNAWANSQKKASAASVQPKQIQSASMPAIMNRVEPTMENLKLASERQGVWQNDFNPITVHQDKPKSDFAGTSFENGILKMYGQKNANPDDYAKYIAQMNDPRSQTSITTPGNIVDTSNERMEELKQIFNKDYKDTTVFGVPGLTRAWYKNESPYDTLNDSDKELVRQFISSGKDNPNLSKDDKKALRAMSMAYGRSKSAKEEEPLDRQGTYEASMTDAEKNFNATAGGFVGFNAPLAKGIADVVAEIPGLEQAGSAENKQYLDEMMEKWKGYNPSAYEAGRGMGQAYDYLLTSPFTGGLAAQAGLGSAGTFALDQGIQAGQDIGLDIVPEMQRMLKEEGAINWGELTKRFGYDVVMNILMGKAGDIASSLAGDKNMYDYLVKTVGNDADIFRHMDVSGALRNAPEIYRAGKNVAEQGQNILNDINAQKGWDSLRLNQQTEIPKLNIENPDDVVGKATRQAEEAVEEIEKLKKQIPIPSEDIPEIKNALPTDDLKAEIDAMNGEMENMFTTPKEAKTEPILPQIEQPKTIRPNIDLPAETKEMAASDFLDMFRMLDDMEKAADATGNSKVREKFDRLSKAMSDYETAVFKSEDMAEVNKAKKATDAARQSFVREMKKIDPNYKAELTGTRIGNAEYRRSSLKGDEKAGQELVDSIIEAENELNNNRFVRDAEPDNVIPFRGVEDNAKKQQEVSKLEQTSNDLWDELKAGEKQGRMKMNLQAFEEPSSRADKMLYDIRYGEDAVKAPETKVSEFYDNSMHRNKNSWDAEDLETLYNPEQFEYLPTTEKTSVKNAYDNVVANRDSLIDRYTKQADSAITPKEIKRFYSAQDVDQMHLLIRDLRNKERMATDAAQKAMYSQQRFEITKHLYDATHSSASVMQAGQKWLNDADGIIDTAEAYRIKKTAKVFENNPNLDKEVRNVADDIYNRFKDLEKNNVLVDMTEAERRAKLREMIDEALNNTEVKRRLGQEDIEKLADNLLTTRTADGILNGIEDAIANVGGIKDETISEIYDIWSKIENLDPGSKKFQKEVSKIYSLLANDIGGSGTFWNKVDSWRYFAMLANPTTHIRNILGNVTMNWMTGIKNDIAAGIEAVANKVSKNGIQGGRTKSILTLKDADLIDQSGKYFDNHAYGEFAQGGNRYMSASSGIDDAMATFKTKPIDKMIKGHSNLLSAEDVSFGKAKYKTSLAGYLKANGADASIFNATDKASKELLEKANKYALEMANEATFHTENSAANALSQFTRNLKESDNVLNKSLGVMIDTTVPFKKTPMNILKNCFEYSPVEFAKVVTDLGKWKRGSISTAKMIDNLAKAVTGTGGMAIGALLAHEGIIKVTNGSSKETTYDKQSGQQSMALNIMGHDIDISFLPPAVMPLIMGATLLNDYKREYGDDYTALDVLHASLTDPDLAANTALESLDTIVDTTMLSGINDLINTIRYADEPQDVIKSLTAKTATNYASQMIPTLAKKTASVLDGQKYASYSDKTGAAKTIDSSLKYLKTTIPGLQEAGKAMEKSDNKIIASIGDFITAEPKINGWGESVQKENYGLGMGGRALDQYLNPATTTKNSDDKTTQEIRELSKRLNDENVLGIGTISSSESKFSLDGKQYKLDEKQWTNYSKIEGQTAKKLADAYVGSEQWESDSDEDKAETLSKMKSFCKAYAQSKVTGAEMSSTNKELANIYEKDGTKGLIEEFHRQEVFSKHEVSKSDGANAVYNDLGEEGIQKYSSIKQKLNGSTKTEDIERVLNTSGMTESDKAKYYSYLKPSANPGSNPYGYIPGVNYDPTEDTAYQKAKKELPQYTPEKYYQSKDEMDIDNNNSIKQDEVVEYMNKNGISEADGMKYWRAFGSDSWKKQPYYSNGKWYLPKK